MRPRRRWYKIPRTNKALVYVHQEARTDYNDCNFNDTILCEKSKFFEEPQPKPPTDPDGKTGYSPWDQTVTLGPDWDQGYNP